MRQKTGKVDTDLTKFAPLLAGSCFPRGRTDENVSIPVESGLGDVL